jgi:hypothetical protein
MTRYQAYQLDEHGHVFTLAVLYEAKTDAEAVARPCCGPIAMISKSGTRRAVWALSSGEPNLSYSVRGPSADRRAKSLMDRPSAGSMLAPT